MRYGDKRRKSSFNPVAFGVMLLALAGVVFAGLAVAGKLPWQRRVVPNPEPGMVRVWKSMHPIPAFATVAPYLSNPETGMANFQDVPQDRVKKGVITGLRGLAEIEYRVMANNKPANEPFVETDFLPRGTLPGVVAGIPPGKRALTLEAGKLKGVDKLQAGDHLDILAALPVARDPTGRSAAAPMLTNKTTAAAGAHQSETRMIARDAVVVSPLETRKRPVSLGGDLMHSASVRTVPVQEIVLAIDRQDVAGVTEAVGMGIEMNCEARSGRPNAEDSVTAPPGMVAVPLAVRFVSAYTEIIHDDLYDVGTRELRFAFLTPEQVKSQNIVVDASELIGRVVLRDRPVWQFFRQEDLAPRGTPPGLTAGVPFGKRAFGIAADQLVGSTALRRGDHVDLLASIPLTLDKPSQGGGGWLASGGLDAAALQLEKQAEIRVVVHDAVVVAPVDTSRSASAGTKSPKGADADHPAEELVLAVSVDEIAKLVEAVSLGMKITVASRSGVAVDRAPVADLPTTQEKPITEFRPLGKLGLIETMNGAKRQTYLYAGASGAVVPNRGDTAAAAAASPMAPAEAAPKNAAATP